MSRRLKVGAAQLGPIHLADDRPKVVKRMIELMKEAHAGGCRLVVFPEMALTTFFPRYFYEDQAEIDAFFEKEMPSAETRPLFETAAKLGLGFYLGYCELTQENGKTKHYNTAILVDTQGKIVGKYRKVHLPGHADFLPGKPFQHLEKRYFDVGDLGFNVYRAFDGVVGMCICNDRRWPETYRVMGLQGVELVVLGYNTPTLNIHHDEPLHLRMYHNHLAVMAGAYQNATWVVSVAKAGKEDGYGLIGGSCVISPNGEMVAQAITEDDELLVATCDLDLGAYIKETMFNFAKHRRPEHYRIITEQVGAKPPGA
jgi:predicted amidohydrolase